MKMTIEKSANLFFPKTYRKTKKVIAKIFKIRPKNSTQAKLLSTKARKALNKLVMDAVEEAFEHGAIFRFIEKHSSKFDRLISKFREIEDEEEKERKSSGKITDVKMSIIFCTLVYIYFSWTASLISKGLITIFKFDDKASSIILSLIYPPFIEYGRLLCEVRVNHGALIFSGCASIIDSLLMVSNIYIKDRHLSSGFKLFKLKRGLVYRLIELGFHGLASFIQKLILKYAKNKDKVLDAAWLITSILHGIFIWMQLNSEGFQRLVSKIVPVPKKTSIVDVPESKE